MPQVIAPPIAGHDLGFGDRSGTRCKILAGNGDPNVLATDNPNADILYASMGSLFLRVDSGQLYLKTALPNTWVAK
jgi:hypothetical protein